jgi:hypothetical protein
MLYRALLPLAYGSGTIPADEIHDLCKLKPENIAILLQKKRIAIYNPPPLMVLSDRWGFRAKMLNAAGIDTIKLLEMPIDELAEMTGKPSALIERWRCELREALGIVEPLAQRG